MPVSASTAIDAQATQAPAYRPDVDGLRALAITCVLAFHAFPKAVAGGFIGVDVFFVISGFLISSIILKGLRRGDFSFADFYARRIRRILPSLCLVMLAVFVVAWFTFLPEELRSLGRHLLGGSLFASNFVLWQEAGYFGPAAETKPLLHLWSLGIEEQFYLIWPLVMLAGWRRGWNLLRLTLAVAALSFVANAAWIQHDPVATFYLPFTRFWEILAGSLLAQAEFARPANIEGDRHKAVRRWPVAMAATPMSMLGAVLLVTGLLTIEPLRAFPGFWALLPVLGTMLLIAAGSQTWLNRRVLAQPAMVWVGLISYPLYLWHWPILVLLRMRFGTDPGLAPVCGALGISVALAWLTTVWIDRPVRFGPHGTAKVWALCSLAVAIAILGAIAVHKNGWPKRFSGDLARLGAFTYDYRTAYREGSCFLRPEQGAGDFKDCTSTAAPPGAPSIVLWGDSHAAHLYPGLKDRLEGRFRLTQLTSSLCPPLLDFDVASRPHCRSINDYVLKRIASEHVDRVILAAAWQDNGQSLVATIARLRQAGVGNVVVIGPMPRWTDGLPRSLYRNVLQDPLHHRVPGRMKTGLISMAALDRSLSKLMEKNGVGYVSPWQLLCNDDGCLTYAGSERTAPLQWDLAHLTADGSRFLVGLFPAWFEAP